MGSRSSGLVSYCMRVVSGFGLFDLVTVFVVFGLSIEEMVRGGVVGVGDSVGVGRVFVGGILTRGITGGMTGGVMGGITGGGMTGGGGGRRF